MLIDTATVDFLGVFAMYPCQMRSMAGEVLSREQLIVSSVRRVRMSYTSTVYSYCRVDRGEVVVGWLEAEARELSPFQYSR